MSNSKIESCKELNSADERVGDDARFQRIFQSRFQHELLDRETEATLANQAQSEMASWDQNLKGLQLTGDAQQDLPQVMGLRSKYGIKDRSALGRLLACNYRIMLKVAYRYRAWGKKRGFGLTDLFSLAFEGYLHAIRKFDAVKNVRLSTYSDYWMRQYIRRELHQERFMIRVPYNAGITANRTTRAESIWRMLHGRNPKEEDLLEAIVEHDRLRKIRKARADKRVLRKQARYAEASRVRPEPAITPHEAVQALQTYRLMPSKIISLSLVREQYGKPVDLPDTSRSGNEPLDAIYAEETRGYIQEAFTRLTPIEQQVIRFRFLNETPTAENMTLQEAGDSPEIGLSRERIRQIQEGALEKLRISLAHLRET